MPSTTLTIEKDQGVATLTLNRPKAMNALSQELRRALVDAFEELEGDDEARVLILTGAGRAFCAGLDLKEMSAGGEGSRDISGRQNVIRAMEEFSGPIIGAINGHAITGGFEVALACDLMIASTSALFADTHIRVGLMPRWGLSQKLSRIVGIGRAKEISLSGNFVDAERAFSIGLVNRVVEPGNLMAECQALACDMASCDPEMLRSYNHLIDEGYAMNLGDALRLERNQSFVDLMGANPELLAERRAQVTARGRSQSE
jgi:enoyl-CoA hydratase